MRNRATLHDIVIEEGINGVPTNELPTSRWNFLRHYLFYTDPRKIFSWFRKKTSVQSPTSKNSCIALCDETHHSRPSPHTPKHFAVLGIQIGSWTAQTQYIFITCGVMIFLLLYGYLQELVVMNKFKRNLGWFVTLLQLSGYAICASIQNRLVSHGKSERRIPLRYYAVLSLLQVMMQGLTNISMHYLNYPAKTLFKSSRVIMTMLFGILFYGKRYHGRDYVVALCMVVGLTAFVAADANSNPTFNPRGVVLVLLALAADAAILNLQEHCMHVFNAGHDELVYLSNVGAALVALVLSIVTGELYKGVMFLEVIGSFHVFGLFMAFSCAGFLGVSCLAALTKRFGALTSAITSVVRKGLTLMLSYIAFPDGKTLTIWHVFGALIFMGSLLLKSVSKPSKIMKHETVARTLSTDAIGLLGSASTSGAEHPSDPATRHGESAPMWHAATTLSFSELVDVSTSKTNPPPININNSSRSSSDPKRLDGGEGLFASNRRVSIGSKGVNSASNEIDRDRYYLEAGKSSYVSHGNVASSSPVAWTV
eukprot:gene1917-3725_t